MKEKKDIYENQPACIIEEQPVMMQQQQQQQPVMMQQQQQQPVMMQQQQQQPVIMQQQPVIMQQQPVIMQQQQQQQHQPAMMQQQPVMMQQQQQQPVMATLYPEQTEGCCDSCCGTNCCSSYTVKQSKCFQKTVPLLFLSTIILFIISLLIDFARGYKLVEYLDRSNYYKHDIDEATISVLMNKAETTFTIIIAEICTLSLAIIIFILAKLNRIKLSFLIWGQRIIAILALTLNIVLIIVASQNGYLSSDADAGFVVLVNSIFILAIAVGFSFKIWNTEKGQFLPQ